jgi:hypothetical protein
MKDISARTTGICLVAVVIIQLALTLGSFRHLTDLGNDRPLLNVDFCSQYYWSQAAREFHARDARIWGYDPNFMAGYPLDFVFNSSLPIQLVAVALAPANLARVIKAGFVMSFVLAPLCFYFALRQFGLGRGPALAASGLGIIHFWAGENALFGQWGMIAGAFILNFFLVPLGLLYRFLHDRSWAADVLLPLALALAFTIHKTAFVLVLPLAALWIALALRSLPPRRLMALAGAFILAALVNLHWLYPFFKFLPLKIEDPATTFFQNTNAFRILTDLWPLPPHPHFGLPAIRLFLLAFGLVGLLKARREARPLLFALVAGLACFGLFSYFGSLVPPLRHLQPYRYITAFYYLWLPAAGLGMKSAYDYVAGRGRGRLLAPGLAAAAAAYLLAALLLMPNYRGFTRWAPLTTELDQPSQAMVRWLGEHTDRGARIMFEDINVWPDRGPSVYGGAKLASLIPTLVPRELIGGPLPNAFIKHHYAAFQDGRLCDRPLMEYNDQELKTVLELYNVGWAVCWSEEAKARLARWPEARREAAFGYLEIYSFSRPASFFLEGSGRVEARMNRLTLRDLTTESGRVVVSYHWVEGLKSEPPAKLVRVMAGPDPVGFIGVLDPPRELTLRLAPPIP